MRKEKQIDKLLKKVQSEKLALGESLNYRFETPFWELFSLSEGLSPETIRKNYGDVFPVCQDNLTYLTELVLVLNLKIWQWYKKDDTIGRTYDELWKKTDAYALQTLKGEDLHYYLSTLD